MTAIAFPSSPTVGQTYTSDTKTWQWDGKHWLPTTVIITGTIPSNTVTTVTIQDSAVTTSKIADGAITTAKITDGSVTAAKLATGAAVPSQTGQAGKYLTTDGTTASWGSATTQARSVGMNLVFGL